MRLSLTIGHRRWSLSSLSCSYFQTSIEGAFQVKDNRVLNGPLGFSLRSFTRTPHSAQCSALLCFAHSLVGRLKSWMCSGCKRVTRELRVFSLHQKHALIMTRKPSFDFIIRESWCKHLTMSSMSFIGYAQSYKGRWAEKSGLALNYEGGMLIIKKSCRPQIRLVRMSF